MMQRVFGWVMGLGFAAAMALVILYIVGMVIADRDGLR